MTARGVAILVALLAAGEASAIERLGVMAVGDPPRGPDPDVSELAHQLRAVCRDRVGGLEEVSAMRAHLLGQESGATISELDRAYGGALAVYQSGEFDSAYRTLKAIIADLEMLPESDEVYQQWVRAMLRLAHTALTLGSQKDMDAALLKLARTDLTVLPDPDQYSPSYRRRFEELKVRVRALPRRKLVVAGEGQDGTVFVNGRKMGMTPLTLTLPAGTYRIGGAAGALRVPSFSADLEGEDRMVVLDFALASALRVNAGPGLALPAAQRGYGIIRAGAWLGLDRLIVVSRVEEGQAQFLLGSMYDVRRGALLREGSVRMVAGSVPSVNLGALAAFLLTGQSSREVKDRTQDGPKEIVAPAVAVETRLPPTLPPVFAAPAAAVAPATPPTSAAPRGTAPQAAPAAARVAAATLPPAAARAPTPVAPPITAPPPPVSSVSAPFPASASAASRAAPASTSAPARSASAASAGSAASAASTSAAPASAAPARPARPAVEPAALDRPPPVRPASPARSAPAAPAATRAPATPATTRASAASAAAPAQLAPGASAPAPGASPASPGPAFASLSLPPATQAPTRPLRIPEPERSPPRHGWMRPTAIGTGILAVGLAGLAVQQGLSSSRSYADASAMLQPNGSLVPGSDPARYRALRADGSAASRNMYLSAGAAAILAGAAGVLGWRSFDAGPATSPGALAFHF